MFAMMRAVASASSSASSAVRATMTSNTTRRFAHGGTAMLSHRNEFLALYPKIVDSLLGDLRTAYGAPETQLRYVRRMLDYNIRGGKMLRGLMVRSAYIQIRGMQLGVEPDTQGVRHSVPVNHDECQRADIVGWALEWMQACFLMADDVIDHSITRRSQPCWFRVPGVGLGAINDSLVLEMMVYRILHIHLRDQPYHADLLAFLMDITYHTELGQLMDLQLSGSDEDLAARDLTLPPTNANDNASRVGDDVVDKATSNARVAIYNEDHYRYLVVKKTAYYSFYAPVALAMKMARITDPTAFDAARNILLPLGEYFQVQDDFLDCYGDVATTGKVGTDIQDGKCSWLVVQALKHASPQQRSTLLSNYGRDNPDAISAVKTVYRELGIEDIFRRYEDESITRIRDLVNSVDVLPRSVFTIFLDQIVRRKM